MNPFDWSGPLFLVFYVLLVGAVIAAQLAGKRAREQGTMPSLSALDPYVLAYLRGGGAEAARVVCMVLLQRGLLLQDQSSLAAVEGSEPRVRRPLERAVLMHFRSSAPAHQVLNDPRVQAAGEALEDELAGLGLWMSAAQKRSAGLWLTLSIVLLAAVAAIKLILAAQRGHGNVVMLWILALSSPFVVKAALRNERTSLGKDVLEEMRSLCGGLTTRKWSDADKESYDFAMFLGVFGIASLDASQTLVARTLFPAAYATSGSSSSSGCGSSCGSSCGGGCGSGCGGCGG